MYTKCCHAQQHLIVRNSACCFSCQHKACTAAFKNMYTKCQNQGIIWIKQTFSRTSFDLFIRKQDGWSTFYFEWTLNNHREQKQYFHLGLSSVYNQDECNIHFFCSIFKGLRNKLNNR